MPKPKPKAKAPIKKTRAAVSTPAKPIIALPPAKRVKKTKPFMVGQREIANSILKPAIAKATERFTKTEIARLMTELTGSPVTRQMVERWLHPNPAQRDHPSLGNGLLLLSAFHAHNNGITSASEIKGMGLDLQIQINKHEK